MSETDVHPHLDLVAFKEAMSRFPSGVTVLMTHDEVGDPVGMTASAFVSVSMTPPLVLESVAKSAQMHAHLMRADRYSVSILSAGQSPISNHFAGFGPEGFEPQLDELDGLPTIQDSVARVACQIIKRVDAGDHTLFIAQVHAVELSEHSELSLIYAQRDYHIPTPLSTLD